MKNFFSLLAVVLLFSSFNLKSSEVEVWDDCWEFANEIADASEASFDDSWDLWDYAYDTCSEDFYGLDDCIGC